MGRIKSINQFSVLTLMNKKDRISNLKDHERALTAIQKKTAFILFAKIFKSFFLHGNRHKPTSNCRRVFN